MFTNVIKEVNESKDINLLMLEYDIEQQHAVNEMMLLESALSIKVSEANVSGDVSTINECKEVLMEAEKNFLVKTLNKIMAYIVNIKKIISDKISGMLNRLKKKTETKKDDAPLSKESQDTVDNLTMKVEIIRDKHKEFIDKKTAEAEAIRTKMGKFSDMSSYSKMSKELAQIQKDIAAATKLSLKDIADADGKLKTTTFEVVK